MDAKYAIKEKRNIETLKKTIMCNDARLSADTEMTAY